MNRWWIAMVLFAQSCGMHGAPVYACSPENTVPPPEQEAAAIEPMGTTGMTGVYYDSNHDGVIDRVLVYRSLPEGGYEQFPFLYLERFNPQTRHAQEVWMDQGGRGRCVDIILYFARVSWLPVK